MTVHVYLKIRNHRKPVVTFASTQLARCIKGSVKVSLVIFVKVSIYVFMDRIGQSQMSVSITIELNGKVFSLDTLAY